MSRTIKPIEERFWAKVQKGAESDCWLWIAGRTPAGYGTLSVGGRDARPYNVYAHRFSFMIHKGAIPDGMLIMHSCDNPHCVNPAHLSLGTDKINADDMRRKGRARYGGPNVYTRILGEKNHAAVLTPQDVLDIRRDAAFGETKTSLARRYGVSDSTIRRTVSRLNWRHI